MKEQPIWRVIGEVIKREFRNFAFRKEMFTPLSNPVLFNSVHVEQA
jgi:hypothetical protein